MELDNIITLIKTVSDSRLTQFCFEQDGMRISMKTDRHNKLVTVMQENNGEPLYIQSDQPKQPEKTQLCEEGNVVTSPLVGTFYCAASPEDEPFVKVGDTVTKGQVLGIVEAMKLMNEIESEYDGVVKEILVSNGGVVEYDQPMFVIE